jgi:hypothetical protein
MSVHAECCNYVHYAQCHGALVALSIKRFTFVTIAES